MFDTADVYGPFANEELVGRALEGQSRRGDDRDEGRARRGTERRAIHSDADARPERIAERDRTDRSAGSRTDVVDLYYLHRVDEQVPLEESWGAMASLVAGGHVRALGLSEVGVDELERAHAIHPVAAVQSELSLWTRDALDDVVPVVRGARRLFVPFSPLGRGFLTGSITSAGSTMRDFRASNPRFTNEAIAANQAIVDVVRTVAARHGATPAQVALAWTLAQGDHVVPIPGTKRIRYLEENMAAAGLALTPEDLVELGWCPDRERAAILNRVDGSSPTLPTRRRRVPHSRRDSRHASSPPTCRRAPRRARGCKGSTSDACCARS